ncbi:hypothetical protein DRO03_01800 [Methanosarcinales archaeon]|nr:MAG: hypothetical protein DRO03_01800 [Methanosarcinales archaeon]
MKEIKNILLVAVVLLSILSMACIMEDDATPDMNGSAITTTPEPSESNETQTEPAVEIILFHGTRRCASCIATGQLLDEVVHTYYKDEVVNGTITFREVNAEIDRKTAAEYGVRYVSVYINHEIYPDAFTYTNDHDRFVEEMRKKIDEALLNGS